VGRICLLFPYLKFSLKKRGVLGRKGTNKIRDEEKMAVLY
jgi:hypothetical protein